MIEVDLAAKVAAFVVSTDQLVRNASQRLEETLRAALPLDEAPGQLDLFEASR